MTWSNRNWQWSFLRADSENYILDGVSRSQLETCHDSEHYRHFVREFADFFVSTNQARPMIFRATTRTRTCAPVRYLESTLILVVVKIPHMRMISRVDLIFGLWSFTLSANSRSAKSRVAYIDYIPFVSRPLRPSPTLGPAMVGTKWPNWLEHILNNIFS